MKKSFLCTGIILFSSLSLFAQTDSSKNFQFKLGSYYITSLNYYGWTDSLQSSGFFPLAEIWFNKNFYLNVAPVFVNNSSRSFDYAGTIATAGYQNISANK